MTHWRKVRAVALFEFLSTVKSKGYLIATFGMPLFVLLYGGFVSLIGYFAERSEEKVAVYGVVDEWGGLNLHGDVSRSPADVPPEVREALAATGQAETLDHSLLTTGSIVFRPFPSEEVARSELLGKRIRGFFRLHPEYLKNGIVERYAAGDQDLGGKRAGQALSRLLLDKLVEGQIPAAIAERVRNPVAEWKELTVSEDGSVRPGGIAAKLIAIFVPIGFAVLLLLAIMINTGGLVQATAIEKENKVVEVLLSSADPTEILLGKLLGYGATGLIQIVVWFGMILVTGAFFAATLAALGVEVPWGAIAAAVGFFLLAYLFFGSIMLGAGSIGSNQRESQQWAMVGSLLAVLPMIFLGLLIQEPHGRLAQVFTWLPFTSPITVVFRLAFDPAEIAWWEVISALAVLVGSTWLALRVGARLFRVGILLTGARPSLREILRQARLQG